MTAKIRQLAPDVARKIAAGEVIDRPASALRELLDNALDAGANTITVDLEGGGIDRLRVADDGAGMAKADLEQAALPHATSKLSTVADLDRITTLGFRGEALSSMAAVANLSITSAQNGESWKLSTSVTERCISPATLDCGTVVCVEGLFENIPARRHFLKRPAAEMLACRQIFIEKALTRPDVAFKLNVEGKPLAHLTAGQSLTERFCAALATDTDSALYTEIPVSGDGCGGRILIGESGVFRTDRKYMAIYVNDHRINEFALLQAIDYGCQGFFPNGTHPACLLDLHVTPDMVDFNIHPAKREARFRDPAALHHLVSGELKKFFGEEGGGGSLPHATNLRFSATLSSGAKPPNPQDLWQCTALSHPPGRTALLPHPPLHGQRGSSLSPRNSFFNDSYTLNPEPSSLRERPIVECEGPPPNAPKTCDSAPHYHTYGTVTAANYAAQALETRSPDGQDPAQDATFRYVGCALGVFLLVEKGDALLLIDQHAAHERILFDRLLAKSQKAAPLLVPYRTTTNSPEDDRYIEENLAALAAAGFSGAKTAPGTFEFSSVSAFWDGTEADFSRDLLENRFQGIDLVRNLAAASACRAAAKEGDYLDDESAAALAAAALALPDPRCPHGRPIILTFTRDELYRLIRRTK